jgi:hypothetical protein
MNQDTKLSQYRQIVNRNSNDNKNNELNALCLSHDYPCSEIQQPVGYNSDRRPFLHGANSERIKCSVAAFSVLKTIYHVGKLYILTTLTANFTEQQNVN